jgi:hypothetical protein
MDPGGGWELRDRIADHSEGTVKPNAMMPRKTALGDDRKFQAGSKYNKTRQWINFADIADWCSRKKRSIRRIERDYVYTRWLLHDSTDQGEFDLQGRLQVAFLHESLFRPQLSRQEYSGLQNGPRLALPDLVTLAMPRHRLLSASYGRRAADGY